MTDENRDISWQTYKTDIMKYQRLINFDTKKAIHLTSNIPKDTKNLSNLVLKQYLSKQMKGDGIIKLSMCNRQYLNVLSDQRGIALDRAYAKSKNLIIFCNTQYGFIQFEYKNKLQIGQGILFQASTDLYVSSKFGFNKISIDNKFTPREYITYCVADNYLYLYGGFEPLEQNTFDDLYRIDLEECSNQELISNKLNFGERLNCKMAQFNGLDCLVLTYGKMQGSMDIKGDKIQDEYPPHIYLLSNIQSKDIFNLSVIEIDQINPREDHICICYRSTIIIGLGKKNNSYLHDLWIIDMEKIKGGIMRIREIKELKVSLIIDQPRWVWDDRHENQLIIYSTEDGSNFSLNVKDKVINPLDVLRLDHRLYINQYTKIWYIEYKESQIKGFNFLKQD